MRMSLFLLALCNIPQYVDLYRFSVSELLVILFARLLGIYVWPIWRRLLISQLANVDPLLQLSDETLILMDVSLVLDIVGNLVRDNVSALGNLELVLYL